MSKVASRVQDGVAVITIANPPHGYMDETVIKELDRAVRRAHGDAAVKVLVITGGLPGIFVQHYDLRELEAICRRLAERGTKYGAEVHIPEREIDLLFRRLESSPKPVIAAINGNAMGGGCELALACDFRLMEQGPYLIGLPEIRIGMLPGAGGTQRMTRLLGIAKAMDLMLHGRRLSPDEALAQGLVGEVVQGSVLERALERARDLASLPALALGHVKRLVQVAAEQPLYAGLDLERALFLELMASPEGLAMTAALNARGGDFRSL